MSHDASDADCRQYLRIQPATDTLPETVHTHCRRLRAPGTSKNCRSIIVERNDSDDVEEAVSFDSTVTEAVR